VSLTDDLLRDLHDALLKNLLARIKSGEEVKAADLEVARKFLADNGVNADAERNHGLKTLNTGVLANLPFTELRA
jgi:hypothetical protein